ncbi:MAG: ferrochelatase, partial [Clostridia bacterium]|nr:ferrochelatase [Clostridia bacterium]
RWSTAYQSAGRRAVPWLGPDVLEQMRDEAARGARAIVVCPAGFVADHLEVLYDIDVECAQLARELGVAFARTASLNDDPAFIEALANVLERRARGDAHA